MTRRFLTLGLAAAVLALGGMNARAGSVTLPTTLDQLTASGATTTPSPGGPTFSDFAYSTSPVGSPPAAGDVSVHALSSPSEAGLQFSGSFAASPGSTVDYAITYRVDAAPGTVINDAFLGTTGTVMGGTGAYAVTETIRTTSFTSLASFEGTNLSPNPPGVTFAGQSSILVEKDMVL